MCPNNHFYAMRVLHYPVKNNSYRMKLIYKTLFLIVLATGLSFNARAQRGNYKPEMYVGATFGMTGSMMYLNPTVDQDILTGYNGGLVFRYVADKSLGVQAELNYSERGWQQKGGAFTHRLSYVEVPFLTHFNFGDKFRFFVNIGPKIGYLVSDKTTVNIAATTDDEEEQRSQAVKYPLDYGFCFGMGVLVSAGKQVFQLDTRANLSMSDVFPNQKKDYFNNSNNLYASVSFAWLIRIK